MKIIFGTTNNRKVEDLKNISKALNLDLEILGLNDIEWNLGEIEENGLTLSENSLIKAKCIYDFCVQKNISYPIITDDAGLFCDALNGEPGIYTARYADDELKDNLDLPKYQCVIKLLRNLKEESNRKAKYQCVVTCMMASGSYFQEYGESCGFIAEEIVGELKKPYFYSVFMLDGYQKVFSALNEEELKDTYRYSALRKTLSRINKKI